MRPRGAAILIAGLTLAGVTRATATAADGAGAGGDSAPWREPDDAGADFAPPAIDAPSIRNVTPRTRVYADASFARTTDLSALPYVGGTGDNLRLAVGGSWRLGRLQLDVELPAALRTTIDVTKVPPSGLPPLYPEDAHQTATSIGDLRLGAQWTRRLPAVRTLALLAGAGLRARLPTHTTTFQFNLLDGTLAPFPFPPFFHVEPALLFGAAADRVSFTMNQGLLWIVGPDGRFVQLPIVLPSIYFWDAHYAVAVRAARALAFSVEANTVIQLNRVSPLEFVVLNDIHAVFLQPAVQLLLGDWRADLVARLGLNRGAEMMGVIGFGGTQSVTVRLTRNFR